MAALPAPPLVAVEEYLRTSYPDGDREYLDGIVVERHVGTPGHSALQKILIVHFAAFEKSLGLAVRPECRTRIGVSVKTLQNWEQDRRHPTGPAAALLRIIAHEPKLAVKAIHQA
jgi:hypothetical protein